MLGSTILFIIIITQLTIYTLLTYFFSLFVPYQIYEMVISTILIMAVTWIYGHIMGVSDKVYLMMVIGLMYLIWYFFTTLLTNTVNKDDTGIIRFD